MPFSWNNPNANWDNINETSAGGDSNNNSSKTNDPFDWGSTPSTTTAAASKPAVKSAKTLFYQTSGLVLFLFLVFFIKFSIFVVVFSDRKSPQILTQFLKKPKTAFTIIREL